MNLTSPKTIREICTKFNFSFSKGLGQNFLLDSSVLETIANAAEAESILEIGPGFGCLTYELAKRKKKVVSIEIDKRLIPVLDYTLSEFDNVKIIEKDILKTNIHTLIKDEFKNEKISVAANLPYYITTPIITNLLEAELPLNEIIVMVQKEVAQRICAEAGLKDYGAVSVFCQYYTIPEIIEIVPSESFMPPPKVDSAVLKLKMRTQPPVNVNDKAMFFRVVKAAFAQRRKTLANCLSHSFSIDKTKISKLLEDIAIPPQIRGERLSLTEFAIIANKFSEISASDNP